MKIVINRCYGGFGLSRKAFLRLRELGCAEALQEPDIGEFWEDGTIREECYFSFCSSISRTNELLIKVVEELRNDSFNDASSEVSELEIVEIPDDVQYYIDNHAGVESIHEKHRVWTG